MERYLSELRRRLEERERDGLRRRLTPGEGVDFASNDYLGLASHGRLRERIRSTTFPSGAAGSRLLRGNHRAHEELEERFAAFKGAEAALFFATGYQANVGLLQALVGRDDAVLSDELNHASLIDGLRLARPREKLIYPHLELSRVRDGLASLPAGAERFVVTESLFSMDGDIAPLDELAALCESRDALLIVDDSHATGVFGGERGSGLTEHFAVERRTLATVSTCGKAFGVAGGFVTGPRELIDHLVNHARTFIYSTAPSPLVAAAILEALDVVASEPWRRTRLLENAVRLRARLERENVELSRAELATPIISIVIGDSARALDIAARIQRRGFDVRALRPPTVPRGTARLRVSVHALHTEQEIDGVAEAIAEAIAETNTETPREVTAAPSEERDG